jgi:hypothetical protein
MTPRINIFRSIYRKLDTAYCDDPLRSELLLRNHILTNVPKPLLRSVRRGRSTKGNRSMSIVSALRRQSAHPPVTPPAPSLRGKGWRCDFSLRRGAEYRIIPLLIPLLKGSTLTPFVDPSGCRPLTSAFDIPRFS